MEQDIMATVTSFQAKTRFGVLLDREIKDAIEAGRS
jgi:hypothetical protein